VVLRGFALPEEAAIMAALKGVTAAAPFRLARMERPFFRRASPYL
jgi:hypothetical protein